MRFKCSSASSRGCIYFSMADPIVVQWGDDSSSGEELPRNKIPQPKQRNPNKKVRRKPQAQPTPIQAELTPAEVLQLQVKQEMDAFAKMLE